MQLKATVLAMALAFAGAATAQLDDKKAAEVMKKAGCDACRSLDRKGVGPSYRDVAKKEKKVPNAAAAMFEKVRKGGVGAFGQVPMPPNPPDKISDADLTALIAWILTK
jgi:cytochrome c